MSSIFEMIKEVTGLGLDAPKLYQYAFERGVLLKDLPKAVEYFTAAAKKFSEQGDQVMTTRALANAQLYRYLSATVPADARSLSALLETLGKLQQIEKIGLQTEMIPVQPLRVELECRSIEMSIEQVHDDMLRLRELHMLARDRFQTLGGYPLLTYEYRRSRDGHNNKAEDRYYYHDGMYQFYEAKIKKDIDPAAAVENLMLASRAFHNCNNQQGLLKVTELLGKWRIKSTCWICGREMQGLELHFSMYRAQVTPYTKRLLESIGYPASMLDLEAMKIAICTPCGSMITLKAMEEADKVRKDLEPKLDRALALLEKLESRLSRLEHERSNRS